MTAIPADRPCSAVEAQRYALALARLLDSLDGEIVVAALVGERESDLLHSERQEVDRVREFLDGRVAMRSEPTHLRGRALAVLDAFADQFESGAEHGFSPSFAVGDTPNVGDGRPAPGDQLPGLGAGHTQGGAR